MIDNSNLQHQEQLEKITKEICKRNLDETIVQMMLEHTYDMGMKEGKALERKRIAEFIREEVIVKYGY